MAEGAMEEKIAQLKKSGESFVQYAACFKEAPHLDQCLGCLSCSQNRKSKQEKNAKNFCRFYHFRLLRYDENEKLCLAGFSKIKDASEEDLKLWLPQPEKAAKDLGVEMALSLLTHVGDQFCSMVKSEKEALVAGAGDSKVQKESIAWKRVVKGVREMCDECDTTLFNFHWACGCCGYVVCISCFKTRLTAKPPSKNSIGDKSNDDEKEEKNKDRDPYGWLFCSTGRLCHDPAKLMLTQIIAGNALECLGRLVHTYQKELSIDQFCNCPEVIEASRTITEPNGGSVSSVSNSIVKGLGASGSDQNSTHLEPVAKRPKMDSCVIERAVDCEAIPDHSASATGDNPPILPIASPFNPSGASASAPRTNDDVEPVMELKHFKRRNGAFKTREVLPPRIMGESDKTYKDTPHSWLCSGKLLRLCDPSDVNNSKLFQDSWKRGQPVLVSGVTKAMDMTKRSPKSFRKEIKNRNTVLVNCMTGNTVTNQPMKKFWDGFEDETKRPLDETGQPMILKLKDWPPEADFAKLMPPRFKDLNKALPLSEYSTRTGRLNLAGRLPDCFVRPDLGPKMYIAYASDPLSTKGTTNLHKDVSDAVNLMMHVGLPKGSIIKKEHFAEAIVAIDSKVDKVTLKRVNDGEIPGAVWHIYLAEDADRIRDFLNKVALERGETIELNHDAIHDQSFYLDEGLRTRLQKEYGVVGYSIVQFLGDAVFIPAGAPHQVRNLHSCIKVAMDFVSPETVAHCFNLTQEFSQLSDSHTNHEDKLQIKNITCHAIKDSIAALAHAKGVTFADILTIYNENFTPQLPASN